MAKDKSLMVTHRTHCIFERELTTRKYEMRDKAGSVNWKSMLADIAEEIQEIRGFDNLPEKE